MPAAEHLRSLVTSAPFVGRIHITVSIGVAQLALGEAVDSWIARAAEALYAAKAVGRNVCYSAG